MGNCQTYNLKKQSEAQLPPLNQISYGNQTEKIHSQDDSKNYYSDQIPQLAKPIQQRLQMLGPLSHQKFISSEQSNQTKSYKFRNGAIYSGEWYNDMPHGKGKYYLPDRSFFEGTLSQNQIQGYGRLIHPNGDFYQGQFSHGEANGKGTYVEGDVTYQGDFKSNLQHGYGRQYNGKYEFEGEFENGMRKKGKLTYKDKHNFIYQGQFLNNKFHGTGVLIDQVSKYQGSFQKGYKHGWGKITDSQGYIYEGYFKFNSKHGHIKKYDRNHKLIAQQNWKNGELIH